MARNQKRAKNTHPVMLSADEINQALSNGTGHRTRSQSSQVEHGLPNSTNGHQNCSHNSTNESESNAQENDETTNLSPETVDATSEKFLFFYYEYK